ncbi:MAG: type I-E CRISPR-associated protein Cse2/CasB [Ruminococcus flavefaciens]|nr:type I-E CRISPR-associated protein Cse2/CasB [Ruminococcus flavefaciens]
MSKSDLVYNYVASKIEYIQSIYDVRAGRKIMANLRHGIGKKAGELPELWGMIFDGLPIELMGHREVSNAEWAIYTALTLYALHQQGNDICINQRGISVGCAVARLVKNKEEDTERILKRLNLVVTSVSQDDLAYHMRGLVQLLKSKKESISLDYARLAKELYLFYNQEKASAIKLSWGRDFYRTIYNSDEKENESNE